MTSVVVSQMPDKIPKSQCEKITVGDEKKSVLPYSVINAQKQQKVSKKITVHSLLAAISAVCDEVTATDLQTDPTFLQTSQNRILTCRFLLYGSLLLRQEFLHTLLQTGQALYVRILMTECYILKSLNKYKN